jgi:phosphate-selective porin OprO/OprP
MAMADEDYDIDTKSTSPGEFEMRRARIGIKGKLRRYVEI